MNDTGFAVSSFFVQFKWKYEVLLDWYTRDNPYMYEGHLKITEPYLIAF